MLFQSMASLWFALALPAIALMYILKRTYTDTEIASNLLWRKALREQEANRPWQKLRRSLLLLLQLLAAALLVLALMRPFVPGQPDTGVIIVLDATASMTAASSIGNEAEDALDEAKAAILAWMRSRPDAGPVTLIVAGSESRLVLNRDAGGLRTLEEALEQVEPSYGRPDLEAALSIAEAAARRDADADIVFATDGRWTGQPTRMLDTLDAELLVVGQDDGRSGNTQIAAFGVAAADVQTVDAAVTLVHYGEASAEGVVALIPSGRDEPAAETPYTLQPGEQRVIAFEGLPAADYYRAVLRTTDSYDADNTAYALPAAAERGRALLAGEGNLFLEKALQLAGVETVSADPDSFEPDEEALKSIDWVVIAGVNEARLRESDGWRQLLDGKPVWTIRSADTPPAGAVIREPADRRVEITPHPVTAYLSFDETHIARFVDAAPGDGLELIMTYGGVPALYAGTVNGYPRLVMTFDLRDSDLPLRTDFPILIAQAAEWMSGGAAANLGRAAAGSRIDVALRAGTARAAWEAAETIEGAGGVVLEADRTADGAVSAVQTVPPVPGLYRFVEYGEDGTIIAARPLAVYTAPEEGVWTSNVMEGGKNADRNPASDGEASSVSDAVRHESGETQGVSVTPWIMAALLLLLAAEWEVYRRGTAY